MSGKLADLLEKVSANQGRTSRKILGAFGPPASGDVRRVVALPRQSLEPDSELVALVQSWLGPEASERIMWPQAWAVAHAVDFRGAFVPLGVGHGKGHIAWLVAEALARAHGLTKTVILVPSGLREAAHKRRAEMLAKGWQLHASRNTVVLGYEEIQLAKNKTLLLQVDPDVIIADEAHYLRNHTSARAKRFNEFMAVREAAGRPVVYVPMSGTMMKKDVREYWDGLRYALGPAKAPVPKGWKEASEWAAAIMGDTPAGALEALMEPGETLQEAFGRRVRETPGVVSSPEASIAASLELGLLVPTMSKRLTSVCTAFDDTWDVPGGPSAVDALSFDRLMSEVRLGYWTKVTFNNQDDEDFYRDAAKGWRETVKLAYAKWSLKLDSDLIVRQAIDKGRLKFGQLELAAWRRAQEIEKWTHVEWFDDEWLIGVVRAWAETGGGLIWVDRIDVGERLAAGLGAPYIGAGEDSEACTAPCAVMSQGSHGTGKNLQRWARNLMITPSPNAADLEQLIGRTHRNFQLADTVTFYFLAHGDWAKGKIEAAKFKARLLETQSGQPQRLLFGDWI